MYSVDGSAFVSSGGFNPTVTIMALALRAARHIVDGEAAKPLARTGGGNDLAAAAGAAALAAVTAAESQSRARSG